MRATFFSKKGGESPTSRPDLTHSFRRSCFANLKTFSRLLPFSARQDLLFFVHCLVPLGRIVADSAPAAMAWYGLVNGNTLAGTGLPRHPWVGSASGGDGGAGGVPRCGTSTAAETADVARRPKVDNVAVGGEDLFTPTNVEKAEKCDAHNPDMDSEEAKFTAMDSVADTDEWSAMLISASLVRSLVGALQACLDARIAARGEVSGDMPKREPDVGKSGNADSLSSPEPAEARATSRCVHPREEEGAGGETDACLGCELDSAQVTVTLALGALLSAHRLAARDRFQLAGGARRFYRIVSQPHSSRDVLHDCLHRREGCTDAAATAVAMPFLHEHCALVAMQVLRLCLRSGVSEVVPPDVIEGAAQMVGALSPLMLSAWGKQGVGRPLGSRGGGLGDVHGGRLAMAKIFGMARKKLAPQTLVAIQPCLAPKRGGERYRERCCRSIARERWSWSQRLLPKRRVAVLRNMILSQPVAVVLKSITV